MLKKDDKSQQVVYYQVCRCAFFVLVMRRLKRRVLGGHRDVHYSGDCDTVLGRRAKEGRHGYCQSP